MEEKESLNIRSHEVQEILGTPPKWIIRWGTTAIVVGILLLCLVAHFIKYSDIVAAPVTITTEQEPIPITVEKAGKISQLIAGANAEVEEGDLLFILDKEVDYQSVEELESACLNWQNYGLNQFLNLYPEPREAIGDLKTPFNNFATALKNLRNTKGATVIYNNNDQTDINLGQINRLQNLLANKKGQLTALDFEKKKAMEELIAAKDKYSNSKSAKDLEGLTRASRKKSSIDKKIREVNLEVKNIKEELAIYQKQNKRPAAPSTIPPKYNLQPVRNSLTELQSAVDNWKIDNLGYSPLSGTVVFPTDYKGAEQYYQEGETVLTIIPVQGDKIVAQVKVTPSQYRNINLDDPTMIRLDISNPEEEGYIEGVVVSKGASQTQDKKYIIQVGLPSGLVTNKGINISFNSKMYGQAEIITAKRRFSERFIDQIKTIFN